jgi:hypothetical protein
MREHWSEFSPPIINHKGHGHCPVNINLDGHLGDPRYYAACNAPGRKFRSTLPQDSGMELTFCPAHEDHALSLGWLVPVE